MVACVKMVLDYYGIASDYEAMRDRFTFGSVGLSMPDIGMYLMGKDLRCEIVMLNPHLFTINDIGKKPADILAKLHTRHFKNPESDQIRLDFIHYVEKGGTLSEQVPLKQDIIAAIDEGAPVIILLVSKLLQGHGEGYTFHGNVIYGYDETHFYLHDPETPELGGGTHRCEQDLVMYAMAVMGHADVDNAGFMIVKS